MKPGYHEAGTTILAVASPRGPAARGIVRLSGPEAWPCVRPLAGFSEAPRPRHLLPCPLRLPSLPVAVPAHLAWMPAPHSYTRENVVEIHSLGSPLFLSLLCDALLDNGALPAGPGEFTRRAFLNGRIDLTRAEAVLDLIHAQDEEAHRLAFEQFRGSLHQKMVAFKERLVRVCAFCEAAIDFSDQNIEVIDLAWVEREIQGALGQVTRLLAEARSVRPTAEGIRAVLAGRPNVGKSSLLNCLASQDAAVVSPFPGTTRDVVEAPLAIRGIPFRLRDAAGVREARDDLERAGVGRTRDALRSADLILLTLDGSQPIRGEDLQLAAEVDPARTLLVINKSDLPRGLRLEDLPEKFRTMIPVNVSARTGQGREALLDRMAEAVHSGPSSSSSPVFGVNTRQRGCLKAASESLRSALASAQSRAGLEFVAIDLRETLQHLGELVGEVATDDILDIIFSQFCIGK